MMQGVLRFANPTGAERKLTQAYMGAICAWLGHAGKGTPLFEMLEKQQRKNGILLVGTVDESAKSTMNKLMSDSKRSDFYKMRMTCLIAAFEIAGGASKLMKGSATEADARFYAETFSSCLGGFAALMEFIGQGVGLVADHAEKAATRAAASICVGGIKLWAGCLGGVAGAIGSFYDWQDADDRSQKGKYVAATLYFLKAIGGGASVLLTIGIGFTFTGPYLEKMAVRTGSKTASQAFKSAAKYATKLAEKSGGFWSRLGFMTWLARASWFVTIAQIAIWYFDEDDLEEWCGKSIFRTDQGGTGFRSAEIEVKALLDAINEVS